MRVLVTGGGGQLGGFLVRELLQGPRVEIGRGSAELPLHIAYTQHAQELAGLESLGEPDDNGWRRRRDEKSAVAIAVKGFKVDFATGEGLEACVQEVKPDLVINAAAIARPKTCEDDPSLARAVNVPTKLIDALEATVSKNECVILHISTDLVYDGATSELYTESTPTNAINMYGQSKIEAEMLLAERWPASIALRSSAIYGRPPAEGSCSYFPEFVDSRLREKLETDFFVDEYRSPIFIGDFLAVIQALLARIICARAARQPSSQALDGLQKVYNFGGPNRLSRFEMARQVCAHNGRDMSLIKDALAGSFDRGVKSPLDTGMDSSRIATDLNISLTSFAHGLALAYPSTS